MCGYFGTKKKSGSNRCSPLNSSIDKRAILFCTELVSKNRNLNQRKSRSLLEVETT